MYIYVASGGVARTYAECMHKQRPCRGCIVIIIIYCLNELCIIIIIIIVIIIIVIIIKLFSRSPHFFSI